MIKLKAGVCRLKAQGSDIRALYHEGLLQIREHEEKHAETYLSRNSATPIWTAVTRFTLSVDAKTCFKTGEAEAERSRKCWVTAAEKNCSHCCLSGHQM